MKQLKIELIIDYLEIQNQNIVIRLTSDTPSVVVCNTHGYETDFFAFMQQIISKLQQQGCIRTAEAYTSALHSLRQFHQRDSLPFKLFDGDMALAYERSLRKRGVTPNTSSFYMRILRAVYNRAVKSGLIADAHPFSHVYTSVGKTEKRAIDLDIIRKLAGLECMRKNERLARDLFLFSFYTRGMSFVDMAYLKKDDLKADTLHYTRSKTGQRLTIKWEPMMQEILNRNPTGANSPYLLPIIVNMQKNERSQYRYKQCVVNRELKKIGQTLNIGNHLTMYVARHSWATIAKSIDIPLEVISQAMGHTSERMTHIYLKSIENRYIDHANRKILELLR